MYRKRDLFLAAKTLQGKEYNNTGNFITNLSFYYYYYIAFKRNWRRTAVKNIGYSRSKSRIYIYGGDKSIYRYPKIY